MNKKNIKKELTKARKFKNSTPGQNRDFETLDANRMFKAYESIDEIHTAKDRSATDAAIADWERAGGKIKKLKFGGRLKGMPKRRRAIVKARKEEVEDAFDYKAKKGAIAAPGSGSIAKPKKAKESDVNKSIEQQMADAMKEGSRAEAERKAWDYKGKIKFGEKKEIEVEDAPVTNTGGVTNWNPLLGARKRKVDVYIKNRRKVDGRTKDYKETVQRVQARRDAAAARELEQKLNMFGVQSNPFREETEMKNKKYLQTKEGSIEAAVVQSVTTESPINPNDARPTLTLPKKYLSSREGSLESAVQNVMVDESISGNMARDLRALDGHQFQAKYRMTKAHAQRAGSGIQQYGRKGKNPAADMDEQHPGQNKGSKKEETDWKDKSDQEKKAKAKSQFDAILKKK